MKDVEMQKVEHPKFERDTFHICLPSQRSKFRLNQHYDLFILNFSFGNWLLCWITCREHLQTSDVPTFEYPQENEESPIGMGSIFGFETCCKM